MEELRHKMENAIKESNEVIDIKLEYESKLDKKDHLIQHLEEEIAKLQDEIKGKDMAIHALSDTLL